MSKRGKSDTWMPIYIGDYLADTMRLSTIQHGAYFLLLMEYWRQGPLPDDMDELAAVARADRKTWDKAIWPGLKRLFHREDDGLLHQKRADRERANASDKKAKRSEAANARWGNSSSKNDANADANASSLDDGSICKSDDTREPPLPLPNPCSPLDGDGASETENSIPSKKRAEAVICSEAEFEEFWAAYEKKEGKKPAQRAFAKARKKLSQAQIMAAVRAWPFAAKRRNGEDFNPNPATWLNQERWNDECVAGAIEMPAEPSSPHDARRQEWRDREREKWARNGCHGAPPTLDDYPGDEAVAQEIAA